MKGKYWTRREAKKALKRERDFCERYHIKFPYFIVEFALGEQAVYYTPEDM